MLFEYQHHVVRDLAWAIASPPLLLPSQEQCEWYSEQWYQALYDSSLDWFQQLDREPEALQQLLDEQKDRRLGKYFETLWSFWLRHHPRFEVIAQNLPLRNDSKTLGELDLLVLDKQSGKCLHWEMAIKFYLGVGDTRVQANWHGPGKKDRLDLKVEHLKNRQSVICQQAEVKAMLNDQGYQVDACGVILKGQLFYPKGSSDGFPVDASPGHLRSFWLNYRDWLDAINTDAENGYFYPLVGYGWLAELDYGASGQGMGLDQLVEAIKKGNIRLPLYVSHLWNGSYSRIFIVPNEWDRELVLNESK